MQATICFRAEWTDSKFCFVPDSTKKFYFHSYRVTEEKVIAWGRVTVELPDGNFSEGYLLSQVAYHADMPQGASLLHIQSYEFHPS